MSGVYERERSMMLAFVGVVVGWSPWGLAPRAAAAPTFCRVLFVSRHKHGHATVFEQQGGDGLLAEAHQAEFEVDIRPQLRLVAGQAQAIVLCMVLYCVTTKRSRARSPW